MTATSIEAQHYADIDPHSAHITAEIAEGKIARRLQLVFFLLLNILLATLVDVAVRPSPPDQTRSTRDLAAGFLMAACSCVLASSSFTTLRWPFSFAGPFSAVSVNPRLFSIGFFTRSRCPSAAAA